MIGEDLKARWLIVGDFNELFKKNEKWGGKGFNQRNAKYALRFMDCMKVMDMGSGGLVFT